MTRLQRMGLDEAKEAKRINDHNRVRDAETLSRLTKCDYCNEESEHVIPSNDYEDRRITCDSDACIDSANADMDGRRE